MTYRKGDGCALRFGQSWFFRWLFLVLLSALMTSAAWAQTRKLVLSTERMFINEGSSASFTVALGSQPTGNVTVTLRQPSNTDVTVDTDSDTGGNQNTLTFTTSDWSTAQSVSVSAATDGDSHNDLARIGLSPKGGGYSRTENGNDLTLAYTDVRVTVVDDDRNAVVLSTTSLSAGESATSLSIREGSSKNFMVRLTSQPSTNVTVTFSENSAFLTLDKTSLNFTNGNWDQFQTLVVAVPEDNLDRVSSSETISVTATGNYAGSNISVLAVDNDTRGIAASVNSISLSEGGSASTFTVSLATEPTASVKVSLILCGQAVGTRSQDGCGDRDWVALSPSTLTFTPSNYGTGQTVTVTPVQDADTESESAFINMAGKGGGYVGFIGGGIKLTVTDNDTPALVALPSNFRVARGFRDTLRVRLATQPTDSVHVNITKSGANSTDLTLNKTGMGFTTSNWNQPQELTVSNTSDSLISGFDAAIELTAYGGNYAALTRSVAVRLFEPELALSESSLSLDEGGSGTFAVQLGIRPTGNVTLTLTQPSNTSVKLDTDANTPGNQNTLTFTQLDWNRSKTVAVSAAHDSDADDITSQIVSITAVGGGFDSVADSLAITVDDDDTPALVLNPGSLSLLEVGDIGSFQVYLATRPNENVTVSLTVSDPGTVRLSPAPLIFTPSNYHRKQRVFVTPDDDRDSADENVTINLTASGGGYGAVTGSISVAVTDDDEPGDLVLTPGMLVLTEGGSSGTFTVALEIEPGSDVTVSLTNNNTDAATISPASLTFTSSNYDDAQTVTVTPVGDFDLANESASVALSASGGGYDHASGSVSVTVTDGVNPVELSSAVLSLTEGGTSETFTIKLKNEPSQEVTVALTSGDANVATVSPASLTFTSSNYDDAQTVTVSPVDDADPLNESADISFSVSGGGLSQSNLDRISDALSVSVSVSDDDTGALDISSQNLQLTEGGAAGTFEVKLPVQPRGRVTVSLTNSDAGAVTVSPSTLDFTALNYDTNRTVTVTPVDDQDLLDESVTLSLSATGGGYENFSDSVAVTVDDDESGDLELSVDSLSLEEDSGDKGTFTVKLTFPPAGDVTVALTSGDDGALTVSPSELTFTSSNYNTAQEVEAVPVSDSDSAPERTDISLAASGGGYDGITERVPVEVTDDDVSRLRHSPSVITQLNLFETVMEQGREVPGSGTFGVRLGSRPSGTVTLTVTQPVPDGEKVLDWDVDLNTPGNQDSVAIRRHAWRVPKAIKVFAAADDDLVDDSAVVRVTASGGGYNGEVLEVAVAVEDNDTPDLVLNPESSLVIDERSDETLEIKLSNQPTGAVTVQVASSGSPDVVVGSGSDFGLLTSINFDADNWNTPQSITVRAKIDIDSNDDTATLTFSASGGGYSSLRKTLSVTVNDTETPNSIFLNLIELTIDEGDTKIFEARLTSAPGAGNTIAVAVTPEAGSDISVNPTQLTFDNDNWNQAQSIWATAGQDADSVPDMSDITLTTSGTSDYNGKTVTVEVTVIDDDEPYIVLSDSSLSITEEGDAGTFTVRLSSPPSEDVTIAIASGDEDIAGVSPASLTFASSNWNTAQTVSVTAAVDEDINDESVSISLTASGDDDYDGQSTSVAVSVDDNDVYFLAFSSKTLSVNESASSTFTVALGRQPTGDVTVTLIQPTNTDVTVDTDAETSGNQTTLLFKQDSWNLAQSVTVSATLDLDTDDDTATVTVSASGGGYSLQDTLSITVNDTDTPNNLFLTARLLTIEEGDTETFEVRLTSTPGAGNTITVAVTPEAGSDISVNPTQLTFDNDDWSQTQTITVTAGEDEDTVPDRSDITLTASGTSDYSGKTATVGVTVIDEDPVFMVLSDVSLSIAEGGTAGSFTIRLSSPPSQNVTVGMISRDIGIAQVSPASLTFSPSDWKTAQTVSVTAAEDDDFTNESVKISITASGGDYEGLSASVAVSVTDDDTYSLKFSDDTLSLNEGTSGSFTVALGARPVGDVTVTLVQPTNTDVTVDTDANTEGNQTTLTFGQTSWDVAQNVYVTASLDSDSNDETATISMTATGGGYGLYGVTGSVLVSVVDFGALNLNIGSYERSLSEGQTYSVDIRLASQPPDDVEVAVTSSDPSAVEITAPASKELRFTTGNWNTAQTLSFRAVEDGDAVNERVVISMSVVGSEYSFLRSLVVTTQDNDAVGLVLSKTKATAVEGVAETFTVKLASQPTGTVTVRVSLYDDFDSASDATIDVDPTRTGNQDTLTFTRINWNIPRTVAVVPASDDDTQDERLYIYLDASGANYQNKYASVDLTVKDDDARGILLSDSSLLLNEGGTASFSLRLAQQPTAGQRPNATVKIHVGPGGGYFGITSSSDTDGSDENDVMLEFTDSNWDTAQTITVSAPQDENSYEERYTLYITALGADHNNINPERLRLRVLEANYRTIQTVIKEIDRGVSGEFLVLESGSTANTFTVRLNSQPTQNVSVSMSGFPSSVLALDKTTLNFFPSNYSTPQTVTITPSASRTQPAEEFIEITLKSATTPAPTNSVDLYRATRVFSVKITRDSTNPTGTTELSLTRPSLSVTAGSQTNTFMVALTAAPTQDIQVSANMSREDFRIASTAPRILTFTSSNWNTPQAVTVYASSSTNDSTVEVILNGQSRIPPAQGVIDPYIMSQTVTVTLATEKRDLQAIGFNLSKPSLRVTEGGTPGTFTVKLTAAPTSTALGVRVGITSGDTAVATVSPASLDFNSTNWQTAQTVSVTPVDDVDIDDERIEITLVGSTTFPPPPDGSTAPQKPPMEFLRYRYGLSVMDDDDSEIVLSSKTLALTEGSGATGSFTVALATQPTADVTVAVASLSPNAATVASGSLTFTRSDYSTAQTVTVTPVDDFDLEDEVFDIVVSASDGGYDGVSDKVAVTVEDDDDGSAEFTLSTRALTIGEEDSGTFTVALSHEPTGTVMVTLSQPDNTDVTLDTNVRSGGNQNTLTFDASDWNEAQRVTVSAVHDVDSSNEGPLPVNVTASGGGYGSTTGTLSISVTDNDSPELNVSVTSLTIDEGMTATFTVALGTEPTANVTVSLVQPSNTDIKLDTDTTTQGNQTTLGFTPGNWSTPQTVTVNVRSDDDSEDETGGISMSTSGGGYEDVTSNVLVNVIDTDTPAFILSSSQVNFSEGESQSFQLSLRTDPSGSVTVTLVQPTNTDVTVDTDAVTTGNQNTLTFNADTWDIPQSVRVSAIVDRDAGNDTAVINITALNSGYGDVTGSVTVNVADPQVPGLVWSEAPLSMLEGQTKNVTVQLATLPTEDVTVTLLQPTNTDVTLDTDATQDDDQTTLSFTASNWDTPQQVAFTAAADPDLDGDRATVNITASGGDYDSLSETLSISVIDKDAPRLVLSQSMLSLNEGGVAASFTAVLSILPTAPVSVSISAASDADLLLISETSLDFTTSDWNTPQTVNINALQDSDAVDEDIRIRLSAAGGNYAGITEEVTVTVDDDEAELVLSAQSLMVDEGGISRSFTVALSSRPTAAVTLTVTSDMTDAVLLDTDVATVGSQNTLDFTQDDWDSPRTIKVTAIEDSDIDEEQVTITLSAAGGDYTGVSGTLTVEVREDDIPRIQLSKTSLALTEGESNAEQESFTVVFSVAPDQATVVSVTSSDPLAAAATTGASLTFTPNDWNVPKEVRITPVEDDDAVDESLTVTVDVTTTGGNFEDQSATVSVSVDDNDVTGLTLSETLLTVGENASNTFTVELLSEPQGQVTVTLVQPANADVTLDTNDQTDGDQNTLTFDAGNWDDAQTVTVSAAEDLDADNDTASISMTASGGDYANVSTSLQVTVTDNDTAGLVLSSNDLDIDEGSTGVFTVKLNTQPQGGDVTVSLTSDDAGAATATPVSLTFTADNWRDAQNVTVTGVDDDDAENESVTITAAASGDGYGDVADVDVTVDVTDDENIEMVLSKASLRLTEGENGSFTVRLSSEPTASVTVSITSSDSDAVTFSPAALTFDQTDWGDDQTVTVTAAQDDDELDGQANITAQASGGGYNDQSAVVAVEVWDDDRDVGLTLSRQGPLNLEEDSTSESHSASFMVKLAAPPVDDVTVSVTSGDDAAVSVSEASLKFTALNWNINQSLTIGAVQDDDAQDEDIEVTLSPSGGGYSNQNSSTLQVIVDDDEVAQLELSTNELSLDEGSTVSLTVSLTSQPTADVTVTFVNPDLELVSVDADSFTNGTQSTMTFRTDDWRTPQTVNITALEDDDIEDGSVRVTYTAAGGDYDGMNGAVDVNVTDNDRAAEEREGATQVLAAVARVTLSGSLDVVSRRFDASAGARRVQFGGRGVALNESGIDDLVGHFVQMSRTRDERFQSDRYGADLFGVNRQSGEWLGSIPLLDGRPALAQPDTGGFSNDLQMLGSFTYALTSSADSDSSSTAISSLWGSSEHREFSGTVQQVPYEGIQDAVWLGYDQRTQNGWLYGVAASRSNGEADYKIRDKSARIETRLRTYMPYIEITGESGSSLRIVYGFGIGEVKVLEINANEGVAKLTMDMTSIGGRWPFLQIGIGGTLSATGSIASSRMTTGSSSTALSISELNVDSQQVRAGLELAHSGFGSGIRWAPRFGVSVRQDEGDGITGSGVEVTAALQMTTPGSRFSLDLNGHWLNSHSAEDEVADDTNAARTVSEENQVGLDEWGASLTFRVASSGASGRGFSMSLGPEWGSQQSDLLNRDEAFNLDQADLQRMRQSAQHMMLATRLGYGVDVLGGMLTPFAEYHFNGGSHASSRLTSGVKFMGTDSFEMRIFGEQRIIQGRKPDNKIGVELRQYLF